MAVVTFMPFVEVVVETCRLGEQDEQSGDL